MKKILLVDDEPDIVEFLRYNLENEGFEVATAENGEEAMEKLNFSPDLIIMDIMMPKMDGYEACSQIRKIKGFERTPIMFLTAKSGEADEVKALELGAVDFVKKPISPSLLIARVRSNIRKSEIVDLSGNDPIYSIGPLTIDRQKFQVSLNGEEKIFARKEFELLLFLAKNPGTVFSREAILASVWGSDVFVVDRTVDVHVRKIREKLGNAADMIETIKGVGYRFRENL